MRPEISESAEAELETARAHYEGEREGLGEEFLDEMERLIARIGEAPMRFPAVARTEARRGLGKRFPYQIVFFVLPDKIRIIAVAHQHRKPRYWRGRS
jgi:plasmid stabilization system protein ParE